jgi:hypothetical protein
MSEDLATTADGVKTVGAAEQRIPVGELHPNSWNPNRMDAFMYEKEMASMRAFGFVDPITVRQLPDGSFEILDGEHRWRAAQDIGMKMVPIWNLGEVPDAIAKQLTIVLNETRGRADETKLSALLADLLTSESSVELMENLPFDPEQFRRLTNSDFDWQELENLSSNDTQEESQWVERIYRMPIDAAKVLDEALARIKGEDEMSDAQALEALAADYLGS